MVVQQAVEGRTLRSRKSQALLAQAGFPNGFEISLWAMPVQRLTISAQLMAQLIQQDWAKIGVRAKIVSYEVGHANRRAKQGGEHDAMLYGWSGDNGDPDNWLGTLLKSDAVHGSNVSKWCDPAFNALIDKARAAANVDERTALYQQAQVIFKQQVPCTPIAHSIVSLPVSKRVKGLVFSPLGGHLRGRVAGVIASTLRRVRDDDAMASHRIAPRRSARTAAVTALHAATDGG